MKIQSRPDEDSDTVIIGTGGSQLNLTDEQLELIAALVSSCRLGKGTYANAAFEIITQIEDVYGSDFLGDAYDTVDPHVTVEDDRGMIVFKSTPGDHYITIEV